MKTWGAVVRPLSPSFEKAIQITKVSLDVDLAVRQHEAYTLIIGSLVPTTSVPVSIDHPDCNFIEDTAVMVSPDLAVGASFAVSSREGEQGPVYEALARLGVRVLELPQGATMDGGDILQIGAFLLVGQGSRTNAQALVALTDIALPLGYQVIGLPVPAGVVHLKSVLSKLSEEVVVLHQPHVELAQKVEGLGLAVLRVPELPAANVLRLNQTLLMPAGFPESRRVIESWLAKDVNIVEVDTSELRKADGALTCGCILLPAPQPSASDLSVQEKQ